MSRFSKAIFDELRDLVTYDNVQPVQFLFRSIGKRLDTRQVPQVELPHLGDRLDGRRVGANNLPRGGFARLGVPHGEDQSSRVGTGYCFGTFIAESAVVPLEEVSRASQSSLPC